MFLTVLDGPAETTTVAIDETVTVGRDDDCSLVLDQDDRVSRQHASLSARSDGTIQVEDLGSTNGVFVNGRRITGSATVRSGETIRIGRTNLAVRATDPGAGGPATVIGAPSAKVAPAPAAPSSPGPAAPAAIEEQSPERSRRTAWLVSAAVALAAVLAAGVVAIVVTRDDPQTAQTVTAGAERGVLQVQAEVDGQLIGTGTGWVYDIDRGLIVTNYHVVGVGTTFSVGVGPDRRSATLVGAAPCEDLAVLRVDRTDDLVELPIGVQSELGNGQEVVALGYPGTASQTPTLITSTGSVSSPKASFDAPALDLPRYPNVVITQTPINPGNSGGPLLNLDGEVVGVNSAGSLSTQNQNYAIGAERLNEILPDLANGDSHGWNGFVFRFPGTPEEVEALGYDASLLGVAVFATEAVPQSPAANTGVFRQLSGQAIPIIGIDGAPMDGTLQTMCKSIDSRRRGDTSTFDITDGVDVFTARFDYA